MWTVLMEGELANTLELTDRGKNLMLLVCLNEEINDREREKVELGDLHTAIVVVQVSSSFTIMKALSLPLTLSLSEQHGVSS